MEPTTRKEFREYCMRRLGYPVTPIEVTPDQVDDRIDDALAMYYDYHYDGMFKLFMKHQITQQDRERGWIEIPEHIVGIVRVLDTGTTSASTLFNVRYQMALTDLWNLSGTNLIPYVIARQHIELFNDMFATAPFLRYHKHMNQLHLDCDWDMLVNGQYLIIECWRILDPASFPDVWKDRWLKAYATALIKRQWGQNIKKVTLQLPGGVTVNGKEIYDEAESEIEKLLQDMYDSGLPPMDFIG